MAEVTQRIFLMVQGTAGAPRSYWHEIVAVLVAKALALIAIYSLFFASPTLTPHLNDHLFATDAMK
jgi:hypothetical protein